MPSDTELLHEADWRRFKSDEVAFFRECWKIKHPEHGAILFDLYDAQRDILDELNNEKFLICLKSRQIGWSTIMAAHCFWVSFFQPDRDILFISRKEDEAEKLLGFVTYGYDNLPKWIKERGPKRMDDNLKKLTFANKSVIESLPSKTDPARGRAAYITVVDEWAFLGEGRTEDQERAWASLEPTSDIGGRIFGLSTANGSGNFFETFWNWAVDGVTDFKPIFLPWNSVPGRDAAWYENKKKRMLPWQLAQEYPSTPEEAFIKSGKTVFDVDMLRAIRTKEPRKGYLHKEGRGKYLFRERDDDKLSIWQLPRHHEGYVIGADVAEGLEHGDYSCAYVISLKSQQVVACWHGHIDADLFGEETLYALGRFYNTALVGVEANNHGLTTCTHLRKARYPRIYYRRSVKEGKDGLPSKQIGWLTNIGTKPFMVDELNRSVRDESDLWVVDSAAIREMLTYVRDEKGKMSGSPHDDRVMALAIANQMRKHAYLAEYQEEKNDEWTMDWWARQIDQPTSPLVIGQNNTRKSWL